jgi:hypothetical protein
MMRRLDGFARGLGLEEATTRQIVGAVVVDMPDQADEERLGNQGNTWTGAALAGLGGRSRFSTIRHRSRSVTSCFGQSSHATWNAAHAMSIG